MHSSILQLIKQEELRQQTTIRLIASENYVSDDIKFALGSNLTNKYSEGYPHARYYEGQEFIDQIEDIAIENAKKLFGVDYVNVQAYSGSPANLAVYFALLEPGDTVIGMSLDAGGHLTHGHRVNFSGKWFNSHQYSLTPEGDIDYDSLENMAKELQPKLIVSGLSAYPKQIDFERIGKIAKSVGAYHLADIAHISAIVATGKHPSPAPHSDVITMTTHKMLRGPRGALILTNDKKLHKKIQKAVFPGLQGGPHNNNIAGIAIALEEALRPEFMDYTEQILKNAKALAEALKKRGFDIVAGTTENHLILVDLRPKNIDGNTLSKALIKVNIETNMNAIPFDPAPPKKPSGIRLGTPAITTIGLTEEHMDIVADFIDQTVEAVLDDQKLFQIKSEVIEFISKFTCNFY
jgi:glycine hydroxymethyltransferase